MSDLRFQKKIWTFDSRKEAINFLLQNTNNNEFYYRDRLRNYEIENQALNDGFVVAINENCPINGFKTGFDEDSLKSFMKSNTDIIDNKKKWIYEVFKEKNLMEEKILELELEKSKIKTSNIWHLIFTILCFPYAIIWAFALMSSNKRRKQIDEQIALLRLMQVRDNK